MSRIGNSCFSGGVVSGRRGLRGEDGGVEFLIVL